MEAKDVNEGTARRAERRKVERSKGWRLSGLGYI